MDKKTKNTDWKLDSKAPACGLAYCDNSKANWHDHREYHRQNLTLPNPYPDSTLPNKPEKNTNQTTNFYANLNNSQGASASLYSSWKSNSASTANSYANVNNSQGPSGLPKSPYGPHGNY